jgi:hypothetical protein
MAYGRNDAPSSVSETVRLFGKTAHAQLRLQIADLPGNGGLRHVMTAGRLPEIQRFRHGDEISDLRQIHNQVSLLSFLLLSSTPAPPSRIFWINDADILTL